MNRFFFRCGRCFFKFTADVEGYKAPEIGACPVCSNPWVKCLGATKGVLKVGVLCNDKCVFAEGPDCSCSCAGRNHGSRLLVPVIANVVDFSGRGPSWRRVEEAAAKWAWWCGELVKVDAMPVPDEKRLAYSFQSFKRWLKRDAASWPAREKGLAEFRAKFGVPVAAPGPSLVLPGSAAGVVLAASSFGQLSLF